LETARMCGITSPLTVACTPYTESVHRASRSVASTAAPWVMWPRSQQQTRNSREISREYIPRRAGTHPHLQGTVYSKRTPRQQDRSEQKRCERGANGRVPRAPHLRQRSVGRRALRRGQERARPGNGTGAIAWTGRSLVYRDPSSPNRDRGCPAFRRV
jgi:hypothetical protein